MFIYGVKDKNTGTLINNLTTKHKKYWDKYDACEKAIKNSYSYTPREKDNFEIVTFKLVEVLNENN